tara:strand:- start:72 stop:491 length:420 start_codon:yes stop_codon:yes gene_type:complete
VAFSQVTYEEIMSINSIDTFKRVAIENGYSREEGMGEDNLYCSLNSETNANQEKVADGYCVYSMSTENYLFIFGQAELKFFDTYENIVSDIKEKCTYYKIMSHLGNDYVAYDCPDSKYKGKIGFARIEGDGYVIHLVEN